MSHIAIDARVINSGTGTYVVKLLEYLQKIDHQNTYSVLVPTKDKDYWQPTNPNFNVLCRSSQSDIAASTSPPFTI